MIDREGHVPSDAQDQVDVNTALEIIEGIQFPGYVSTLAPALDALQYSIQFLGPDHLLTTLQKGAYEHVRNNWLLESQTITSQPDENVQSS